MLKHKLLWALALGGLLAVGIALAWRFTGLANLVQPEHIAQRLEAAETNQWSPYLFIAAYVLGGLVMFPVTVLGAASALVFSPLKAIAVSFTGALLSAALLHWLGHRFINGPARKALGPTIERLEKALSDRGVVTIAAIRMIPIAPFTLVNLAAGSLGVRFRDYMLGTALGLAPGITMVCLFGRQLRAFWRDPSGADVLMIVVVALAWIAVSVGLQKWVSLRRRHA